MTCRRQVDEYNIVGPTILHQHPVLNCLNDGLRLTPDESLYERGVCGGSRERSSSTVEIPDIDINTKFRIPSVYILVHPTQDRGGNESFLYKIEVIPEFKAEVDKISLLMQYHPNEGAIEKAQIDKSIEKSYVMRGKKILLSSHLARWQLLGAIKKMREYGLEVDDSSRRVSEVGLKNGVYNVMIYDTMVCRRGVLRRFAFRNLLVDKIDKMKKKDDLIKAVDLIVSFFPSTGVQVDYTAGFHISRDAIPTNALGWVYRAGCWPSEKLKQEVLEQGAVLVPKTFKDGDKNEKSVGWRINFDLVMILNDPDYSQNIDTSRILIILKDLKNIKMKSSVVKSYTLKVCLIWAMYELQDRREQISNKDLLIAALEHLQAALSSMKLPDFFNEKFNHFHRNKDRKYEAAKVAETIKYCVEHLEETLDDLNKAQEVFRENMRREVTKDRLKTTQDVDEVVRSIGNEISGVNPSDIERAWMWMMEIIKSHTSNDFPPTGAKSKGKRISTPENRWQRKLKKSYDNLFKNRPGCNYDSKFIFPLPSPDDVLSISILENFNQNKELGETTVEKLKIWAELDGILKRQKMDCEVAGFGSSFTGFGLHGCDLDIQVFVEELKIEPRDFLFKLRTILISEHFVDQEGARVVTAKVPVLKVKHKRTSICLDVSLSKSKRSSGSVRAAHLFYHCAESDTRVRPLVLAVKKWAKSLNINDPYKKSLSSHAIAIMVIHYLQVLSPL